jgi:hypothetical protein
VALSYGERDEGEIQQQIILYVNIFFEGQKVVMDRRALLQPASSTSFGLEEAALAH